MTGTSGEARRGEVRLAERRPMLLERIQKPANERKENEKRGQPAPEILREW
jgi:hypothetical protein